MMEVLVLLESLELFINALCLVLVRFYRKIAFVLVSNVFSELLLYLDLRKPILQMIELSLQEVWQVILDLFISEETQIML